MYPKTEIFPVFQALAIIFIREGEQVANISFYLPCKPFWHEGIYQLETSDPATGYNPVLSTDGPANRQWNELGDRTLWLRAFLDAGHKDGLHHIRAENILPGSRIPERKLRLNYATHDLAALLAQIESGVEKARDILALRNSQELSPAAILGRILPSLREYYDSGASFDLLNATASLREFAATGISKEISGDDSLDVISTAGIYPDNTYFLMDDDGSRLETATVLSVLTDTRIRFTRALEISRTAGILSSANIPPAQDGANILHDFVWQSDWLDDLSGYKSGKLYIHRDAGNIEGKAFWQESGSDIWHEAEFLACDSFYDGTCDDVFLVPGVSLRLRVEYPASSGAWKLYWLALQATKELILPETIKRPQIEFTELAGKNLTVRGTPYASLWDLPQDGFEMRVGIQGQFTGKPMLFGVRGKSQGMSVVLADECFLSQKPLTIAIRHSDIEGSKSRWSGIALVGRDSGDDKWA